MDITFNAVYRKVPEGYIGFVEELPGTNTQGLTLDETRFPGTREFFWKIIGQVF